MSQPQPAVPRSAFPELVALAVAWRPGWTEPAVAGAIRQAADQGMTRDHILVTLARLMADPGAAPGDLVPSATDPTVRRHPDPDIARRGAAAARQQLSSTT